MQTVAVVPIFMSAGAAVLPTIVAAVTSVLAVALKPRELFRLCRRRPGAALVGAAAVVLVVLLSTWWLGSGTPARAASARPEARGKAAVDWAKVAEDLLAQERAGRRPSVPGQIVLAAPPAVVATTAPAAAAANPSTTPAAAAAALVLGRDYTRAGFDGGSSPTGLNPLWRFRPEDTMFLSAPVVAGARVFVAGCQSDLGGYTGLLACLDAETGKPLWQVTQLGNDPLRPFFSSPALTADGKYLLIGQGLHQDRDCPLLCFDAATGELKWAVKTTLHIESSPAVFGDTAFVGAGAIEGPDGKPTGDPGFVLAVRISDGKELWRQPVNDPESAPAVDENGVVYIGSGFNGTAIVALRSEPDDVLKEKKLDRVAWRTQLPNPVTCPITLAGDLVVAGSGNSDVVHSNRNAQGSVVALDRKTGHVRWQTAFDDGVLGAVAARGGTLVCPVRTGEVAALSQADGKILWRAAVSGNVPVIAGCAFTGTHAYAVSGDGYLAVIDAKAGKVLGKTYLNDQAKPGTGLSMCPPLVAGGRVYVGSETGGFYCLSGPGGVQ